MEDTKLTETEKKIQNITANATTYPDYYSHVVAKVPKKKRKCLKCRMEFISAHYGNCCCGSCAAQNAKASLLAGYVPL